MEGEHVRLEACSAGLDGPGRCWPGRIVGGLHAFLATPRWPLVFHRPDRGLHPRPRWGFPIGTTGSVPTSVHGLADRCRDVRRMVCREGRSRARPVLLPDPLGSVPARDPVVRRPTACPVAGRPRDTPAGGRIALRTKAHFLANEAWALSESPASTWGSWCSPGSAAREPSDGRSSLHN